MEWLLASESEWVDVAQHLEPLLTSTPVVLLRGPLGAGKTTLVKHLARVMGINDAVSSPTFSIINTYVSPNRTMHHMDLYRLKSANEAFQVGMEDYIYSGEVCMIEWPDVALPIIPKPYVEVSITLEGTARRITINPNP